MNGIRLFTADNTIYRLPSDLLYQKTDFPILDQKWEKCRRMQVFSGDAWCEALIKEECDKLIEIWKKKRLKPNAMTFGEVATYVELSEKIFDYRYRVKVERARLRQVRSRDKKKAAEKQRDQSTIVQSEASKSSNETHVSEDKESLNSPTSN